MHIIPRKKDHSWHTTDAKAVFMYVAILQFKIA